MTTPLDHLGEVGPSRSLGPGVSNRFVVTPDRLGSQLPFVLLVEDFISPGTGFHPHPHRGLETVTFILAGRLRHRDHLGTTGVLEAGDVQWMTAGRGIEHGGEPVGGPVHALQLWVALPSALRNSAPATREQRLGDAMVRASPGASVTTYGASVTGRSWSEWPLALSDVKLDQGASGEVLLQAGRRAFVYVLEGALTIAGSLLATGEVGWIEPSAEDRPLTLQATSAARAVVYDSPSFEETIVAHGPFVAGSVAEIDKAFADLRTGRLLAPTGG